MSKLIKAGTLLFLLITNIVFAQEAAKQKQVKAFYVEPEQAIPGAQLTIHYNDAITKLAGKSNITGRIYTYRNYQWFGDDLVLKKTGSEWTAPYTVPKDAMLIACAFQADSLQDLGGKETYGWMVQDGKGGQVAGAYVAWALLRNETTGMNNPAFKNPDNVIGDDVVLFWINQQIKYHPESRRDIFYPAMILLKKQSDEKIPRIREEMKYILGLTDVTEHEMFLVTKVYAQVLNDQPHADSVRKLMAAKYPNGNMAKLEAYKKVETERDAAKKLALGNEFLKNYPADKADIQFDQDNNISYARVYQNVISIELMNKNFAALNEYIPNGPYDALAVAYYKAIEVAHKSNYVSDEELVPYSTIIIKRMEFFRDNRPAQYQYMAPSEWKVKFNEYFVRSALLTHVDILKKTGHYEEALHYADMAQDLVQYRNADLNGNHAFLLDNAHIKDKLDIVMKNSVNKNQTTPWILDKLKEEYVKKNKSDKGFDEYIQSLKDQEQLAEEKSRIGDTIVNKKMTSFTLYDPNGKPVTLESLKGKTVVLDFWASWCAPCKASFPGMKLAVEKYKNDPTVAFFFVDTQEHGNDYHTKIMNYIKDNNYPFQVLFDSKAANSKSNDEVFTRICADFHISGIPQKLIIDKNGNLRFITVGYKGSPSELSDEITTMIELARKGV